jgi:hypothetical protein
LLKDFALGMVADDAGVDEAAEIQPLGSEMRHVGLLGIAEMQAGMGPGGLEMEVPTSLDFGFRDLVAIRSGLAHVGNYQ